MKNQSDQAAQALQIVEARGLSRTDLGPFVLPSSFWAVDNPLDNTVLLHAPFFFWIVEALRPRVAVTVGSGSSSAVICSSLCQAVGALGLPSRCFWFAGLDWEQERSSSPECIDFLKAHEASYAGFSSILAVGIEESRLFLQDGTIDILAIDGLSSKVAPEQVIEQMRPYLSDMAVGLIIGPNSQGSSARSGARPGRPDTSSAFSFVHGDGLEVVGLGQHKPPLLEALLDSAAREPDYTAVRMIFSRLGQTCLDSCQLQEARRKISWLYKVRNRLRDDLGQKEALLDELASEAREARSRLSSMSHLVSTRGRDGN